MRHALGLLAAPCSGYARSTALESNAHAQEAYFRSPVPAPSRAFELQLSAGYTQGFGNIFPNHAINDVAGAGVGITAAIGLPVHAPRLLRDRGPVPGVRLGELRNVAGHRHERRRDAPRRAAPARRSVAAPRHRLPVALAEQRHPRALPLNGSVTDNVSFSGWDVINARIGYDVRSSGRRLVGAVRRGELADVHLGELDGALDGAVGNVPLRGTASALRRGRRRGRTWRRRTAVSQSSDSQPSDVTRLRSRARP